MMLALLEIRGNIMTRECSRMMLMKMMIREDGEKRQKKSNFQLVINIIVGSKRRMKMVTVFTDEFGY